MDRIEAERRAPFGGSPEVGARGRRTQQRIQAAAMEVFDEVGYRAAGIDAITERAGCSRPTFYQYFSSKADLFNRLGGLLGTSLVALTEGFPVVAGTDDEPADDLRAWMGELVDLHARWAAVFASFRPALRGDPVLLRGAADLTRLYGKSVARSVLDDGAGDEDLELVASLVMTMLTGSLTLHAGGIDDPIGPEEAADQLTALLHAALSPSGGGDRPAGPPDDDARSAGAGARTAGGSVDVASEPAADGSASGDRPSVEGALEESALVVFPRLGLEGTRVDDLVEEAGVAHGTFYRYFSDKDELFERVAGRAATAMYELLADLPAAVAGGRIVGWSEAWFARYLDHGAILSVWSEAPRSEAGFSEAAAAAALELLEPATRGDERVQTPMGVLAVLSLIEWAPYLVQQFDGFDLASTSRATAVVLDRLLGSAPGSGAAA